MRKITRVAKVKFDLPVGEYQIKFSNRGPREAIEKLAKKLDLREAWNCAIYTLPDGRTGKVFNV